MSRRRVFFPSVFCLCLFLISCSKGYDIRVNNLYIESMDSVVIGDNKIVFEELPRQMASEYKKLEKGTYRVTFISKSKNRFPYTLDVPKRKQGKRTLQIDGTGRILLLED